MEKVQVSNHQTLSLCLRVPLFSCIQSSSGQSQCDAECHSRSICMIFGSSALVLLLCRKLSVGSNIGKEKHCQKVKTQAEVIVTECTGCCHNNLPRVAWFHWGFCCGLCTQGKSGRGRIGIVAGLRNMPRNRQQRQFIPGIV